MKQEWVNNKVVDCSCFNGYGNITSLAVLSFVELVKYVFTIPGMSLFLSNRICQDHIESFFGQQRQRGRVNENPSTSEFLRNTQALRVIGNTCSNIRGNCRGGVDITEELLDAGPLPKRPRKPKKANV